MSKSFIKVAYMTTLLSIVRLLIGPTKANSLNGIIGKPNECYTGKYSTLLYFENDI